MITPFKDISLIENEFLSFAVIIHKEQDQKIICSYGQSAGFMDGLYNEKMEESTCKDIINYRFNSLFKKIKKIKKIFKKDLKS